MIFEENVPNCLVEGVNYEAEVVSGLLTAGTGGDDQQQQAIQSN